MWQLGFLFWCGFALCSSETTASSTIRISYDTSQLTSFPQKEAFERALTISNLFITSLVQINTRLTTHFYPPAYTKCSKYSYSYSQKINGFDDTDLQLLIGIETNTSQTYDVEMSSAICLRDTSTLRPILGEIIVSVKSTDDTQVTLSNQDFMTLQNQILHEISHILAFNVYSHIDYASYILLLGGNSISPTKYPFLPSTSSTTPNAITTSYVLEWARIYYNCSTLDSVPIETTYSTGRFRWNRVTLLDDINSGLFVQGEQYWSGINNALLKDTGWYTVTESMYDSRIQYGQNRGCLFISVGCTGSNYFPEFCLSSGSKGLNLSRTSQATCTVLYSSTSTIKSTVQSQFQSCMFYKAITTRHCKNTKNASVNTSNSALVSEFNFIFSTSSRAFSSTLTPFSYTAYDTIACFEATCNSNSNSIAVTFGEYTFTCAEDGSFVYPKKPFEYTGRLSCPSSISKFCSTGDTCSDYCSQYGYCMNSTCTCINSRSGVGCQCSNGQKYKNGSCQVCEIACKTCNDSGVCEKCENGYYLLNEVCYACDESCLTCSSSTPTICDTCKEGYMLNLSTNLCEACPSNCQTCSVTTLCTQCNVGFGLNSTTYQCSFKCDYNCNKCQDSPVNCLQCADGFIIDSDKGCKCKYSGYFDDPNNVCTACIENCYECENATECQQCNDGYELLQYQKICQLTFSVRLRAIFSLFVLIIMLTFVL